MAASLRQDSPVSPSHQPTFDQRFKPDLVNKIEVSNSGDVNGVVKIRCGHKKIFYDLLKYFGKFLKCFHISPRVHKMDTYTIKYYCKQ